jgi:hypothetical protein
MSTYEDRKNTRSRRENVVGMASDESADNDDYAKPQAFHWFSSTSSVTAPDLAPLNLERQACHRLPGAFSMRPGLTMELSTSILRQQQHQRGGLRQTNSETDEDDDGENDDRGTNAISSTMDTTNSLVTPRNESVNRSLARPMRSSLPASLRELEAGTPELFRVPVADLVVESGFNSANRLQPFDPAVPFRNNVEVAQEVYTGQVENTGNADDENDKTKASPLSALESERTDSDKSTAAGKAWRGPYGARLLYTIIATLVLILLVASIFIVLRKAVWARDKPPPPKIKPSQAPFGAPTSMLSASTVPVPIAPPE